VGFSVATSIYGISVLQVYLYYRNYPTDRVTWKFTVALLFVLDTLTTIFAGHALYSFYVLNFGKDPSINLAVPWSFSTEKLLVTLTTFVAQCFYANAVWKVTVNKIITASVAFLALASLSLGIVTTVELFTIQRVIGTRNFSIISGLVQGLAALNDVIIAVSMCYHLYHNRSGLPSIVQILFLVTNVAIPGSSYWQPFHQAVGKLYVNSVLATLNVRKTFQQKSEVQLGTGPAYNFNVAGTGQVSVEC
ncbi:hypothetical protein B0H10DRAFT_1988587, partial [Mycena sp. CBHHK59/15]